MPPFRRRVREHQRRPAPALTLTALDQASNTYASPIKIDRSGLWNIRISATREGKTFTRRRTAHPRTLPLDRSHARTLRRSLPLQSSRPNALRGHVWRISRICRRNPRRPRPAPLPSSRSTPPTTAAASSRISRSARSLAFKCALDLGGLVGVQRVAAGLAAAVMVGFGTVAVLRHLGVARASPASSPPRSQRPGTNASQLPPLARSRLGW